MTAAWRDTMWYGIRVAGFYFRLFDTGREMQVLRDARQALPIDRIPYDGTRDDPRGRMRQLAIEWTRREGADPR